MKTAFSRRPMDNQAITKNKEVIIRENNSIMNVHYWFDLSNLKLEVDAL
jgi:hypothetical protein